jgi:hypothetical protein
MKPSTFTSFACAFALTTMTLFAAQEQTAAEEATPETAAEGWHYDPGSGLSYGEVPIVTASFALAFDSKYLSYGLADNNEPILTPSAEITFADWLTFSVSSIFDMTKYGRKHVDEEEIYCNRAGKYVELDPGASIGHTFKADDYDWLPTTIEFSIGYMYEYHPRSYNTADADTQFITFDISLPDLWLEPTFSYERDIDRDNGTYLNLELGHTFELCDTFSLRPSIAQGLGNTQRVKGYLTNHHTEEPLDHGGLMDTCIKLDAEWALTDWLTLGGYVAYSDYIFDQKMRDAARDYEASGTWDHSYQFTCGLSVTATF